MKKTGIFYGSNSGTTESIAGRIAERLGIPQSDIHNVGNTSADTAAEYEVLILGSSTWGAGDLQDDWYDFLPKLQKQSLNGKLVAIFGCGDSVSFGDTFCDAIGTIYNDLQSTGCTFIGRVNASEYSFDNSTAVIDGYFVGLPLDEMNEESLTDLRIANWIEQLKQEGLE